MLAFEWLSVIFVRVVGFTTEGARFVFGNLAVGPVRKVVWESFSPSRSCHRSSSSPLCVLDVLPRNHAAHRPSDGMGHGTGDGTSGAESLSNTASIFVGQTEAPLIIKPFLKTLTRSELLTIMIGGMCTIAGGVMACIRFNCSAIAIPGTRTAARGGAGEIRRTTSWGEYHGGAAGLAISKILYPETGTPVTKGSVRITIERPASNAIEAAAAAPPTASSSP